MSSDGPAGTLVVEGWQDRPHWGVYALLFLVSMGLLTLEISLTRLFSYTVWYHFAYLTISVALLGWGPPDGVEVRPIEEMVELFRIEDVNPSPAVFDIKKLTFVNGEWVRRLHDAELGELVQHRVQRRMGVAPGLGILGALLRRCHPLDEQPVAQPDLVGEAAEVQPRAHVGWLTGRMRISLTSTCGGCDTANMIARAMSSGWRALATGLSKNGVSTMPGSIEVTRTPVSLSSWRADSAIAVTACFVAL